MRNTAQDIYGTDRKRPESSKLTETQRVDAYVKPYVDALRRRQLSTLIFAAIVIAGTITISALIVWYKLDETSQPSARWSGRLAASIDLPSAPGTIPEDAQTLFLMDELTDQKKLLTPQDAGEKPLTAQWVKQAAYFLVQAEKAERSTRHDDALVNYEKALAIFPDLTGVQRRMGLILLRQKEYAKAAAAFEKVPLEEDLTFGLANNLGVSYLAMEEYDEAEKNFLIASKLNPQYPLAYFNLATLYLRTGDLEKSSEYFEKYLTLKPEDVGAAQTYAMILIQLKRWDRAISILDQISRFAPEVAPIHFRLAEALSHTANRKAAVDALRRGTQLVDPRKALAWMSRPEYDLLREEPGFQELLKELGSPD